MFWTPIYSADEIAARLALSFLQSEGLKVRLVADVSSDKKGDPAASGVRTRYAQYLLVVPQADAERAKELIEEFQSAEESS